MINRQQRHILTIWGEVEQFASQCSAHWFNHHDTVHRRYDDPILVSGYCAVAALDAESQGGVIKDTIVFTHSMANVIFATALKQGVCSLDSSSSWYTLSPPLYGSKAVVKLQQLCQGPEQVNLLLVLLALEQHYCTMNSPLVLYGIQNGFIANFSSVPSVTSIALASAQLLASAPNVVGQLTTGLSSAAYSATALVADAGLDVIGVLDPSVDVATNAPTVLPIYVNAAYVSLNPADPGLVGLDQVVNSHSQGGVCGTSPFGLTSEYSLELTALSAYVGYGEPNDGLVPLSSCQGVSTSSAWADNPQSNYYIHTYNHADTTGRNGGPITAYFGSRQ